MKKKIKCDFSSVGLQLEHRTISCKIKRDNLSLETADELFSGHRLNGTIEVVRDDESEGQLPLIEDTLSAVTAAFAVKAFKVGPEEIGCTLVFAKDDIGPLMLDGFLRRSGKITVTKTEAIPE